MSRLAVLRALLIVLALAVPAGLVAAPAQAATRTTLSLSNSITYPLPYGGDGQVKARLRTSSGKALGSRTVGLWSRTPGTTTWRRLSTTRTMRNGLAVFPLADLTRTLELQARFAGGSGLAPVRSGLLVQRVVAPLSAPSVPSEPVFQGDAVTVRARTTSALGGSPAIVERYQDSTWTEVGRSTIGPDGAIEVTFTAGDPSYDGPHDTYLAQHHRVRTLDGVLASAERDFTITPSWWLMPHHLFNSAVGQPLSGLLEPQGGTAPFAFSVTAGALPPGVSLSPDGRLSGTPAVKGTSVSRVTVTDARGRVATGDLTIYTSGDGLVIETQAFPDAVVGQPYEAFVQVSEAVGSVEVEMEGLPEGLSYAQDGSVWGTPQQAGSFTVRVHAFDTDGNYAMKDLPLQVSAG